MTKVINEERGSAPEDAKVPWSGLDWLRKAKNKSVNYNTGKSCENTRNKTIDGSDDESQAKEEFLSAKKGKLKKVSTADEEEIEDDPKKPTKKPKIAPNSLFLVT